MPTCPGCGETVPYARLRTHVHSCPGVWTDLPEEETQWAEQIAAECERLDAKMDALLSALDAAQEMESGEEPVPKEPN